MELFCEDFCLRFGGGIWDADDFLAVVDGEVTGPGHTFGYRREYVPVCVEARACRCPGGEEGEEIVGGYGCCVGW